MYHLKMTIFFRTIQDPGKGSSSSIQDSNPKFITCNRFFQSNQNPELIILLAPWISQIYTRFKTENPDKDSLWSPIINNFYYFSFPDKFFTSNSWLPTKSVLLTKPDIKCLPLKTTLICHPLSPHRLMMAPMQVLK